MKITVLGGCGAVGSIAVRMLASSGVFSEVLIGDINLTKAQRLASTLGPKVSAIKVDALNSSSIEGAISGSSVVLNFIGPFYKFGPSVMKAAISSGINYVDICDDVDATEELMAMDKYAKDAGVDYLSLSYNHILWQFRCISIISAYGSLQEMFVPFDTKQADSALFIRIKFHNRAWELSLCYFYQYVFKKTKS